jgi:hypothetical protein
VTDDDPWRHRANGCLLYDDKLAKCTCHDACPGCGKPAESFACKIRHVGVTIGWGRAQEER